MLKFLFLAAIIPFSFSQSLPSLRWVQELDNAGLDTLAGLGTDSQGNTYVAGSTYSPNFPVKSAIQNTLATAGLFRIDATGSYTRLGTNVVVTALAADPVNPNVFFAASNGAAVKSVDGGNTWTPLSIPSTEIQQFVIDPSNDKNVYASAFDLGFFKSADGGTTWNLINNGIPQCTDCGVAPGTFGAWKLWIDPNTRVLFASTVAQLYRSADAGASWQAIGPNDDGYGVYFETSTPGLIYVFPVHYGPLRSTDDGLTFQGVSIPVNSIFADPNRSGRLLGNGSEGVYESDDDGVTWTLQLKMAIGIAAADWADGVLYAPLPVHGIVQISSDLKTVTPFGPQSIAPTQPLVVANGRVYVPNSGGANAYVIKYDPSGNVVYSTYFGGSGGDLATAMAVDSSGNVYVTGSATSLDFPVTKGTYSSTGNVFLFKLNPDGSVAYSTLFPSGTSTVAAIAVDTAGSAYIAGTTNGGLPTTPGAYKTVCGCFVENAFFFSFFEPDAFLTKFDPAAATLVYSTYLGVADATGQAVAVGPDGSAYLTSNTISSTFYHFNAAGSSLLGSALPGIGPGGLVVGPDGSVYMAGAVQPDQFHPTVGAFQTTAVLTGLPYQGISGAAIVKMDPQLQSVLAATYFGSPYGPAVNAMAVDGSGNVYIAGSTSPRGVPTRTPLFGPFAPNLESTGFLSEFSSDLSTLRFSTYLGDAEPFEVRSVATASSGSVVIAGTAGMVNQSGTASVYLNSLTVTAPPSLRIDALLNAASVLDGPISGGETIYVQGAGFGGDAQLTIGGAAVPLLSITPTQLTAVVPVNLPIEPTAVQVQSGGGASNQVLLPMAAASPGLFWANGPSGGQGYILNQDGTLNTPSNPATLGEQITIFATGIGPVSFTDGYAVTALAGGVYIDGFYCNGVSAVMGPVAGFPGSVYQLKIIVPIPSSLVANNPDLQNFKFPPLVGLIFQIGGGTTQNGLSISIAN